MNELADALREAAATAIAKHSGGLPFLNAHAVDAFSRAATAAVLEELASREHHTWEITGPQEPSRTADECALREAEYREAAALLRAGVRSAAVASCRFAEGSTDGEANLQASSNDTQVDPDPLRHASSDGVPQGDPFEITGHPYVRAEVCGDCGQNRAAHSGERLTVQWATTAIREAVERVGVVLKSGDLDAAFRVNDLPLRWMDLACLVDAARAVLREDGEDEEVAPPAPAPNPSRPKTET